MESFADETTTKKVNQLWSPAAPTMATILDFSSRMAEQTWIILVVVEGLLSVENALLSRNTEITAVEINIAVD